MKKLRIAAVWLMTVMVSAAAVFADVPDPEEEVKHSAILPVLIIAVAVIVIVLIIRAKRKKQ